MVTRISALVLLCVVCLVCGPSALAQKPRPDITEDPPAKAKPAADAKQPIRVFSLRHSDAREMSQVIHELYRNEVGKTLRVAVHQSTNTLILRCDEADMEAIEALVTKIETLADKLDIKPPAKDRTAN